MDKPVNNNVQAGQLNHVQKHAKTSCALLRVYIGDAWGYVLGDWLVRAEFYVFEIFSQESQIITDYENINLVRKAKAAMDFEFDAQD